MKYLLLFLFAATVQFAYAQNEEQFITKSFVIIKSAKSYTEAKTAALKAAATLKQKLNLRDLKPNKQSGLTYPDSVCENEGGYPCYIARGRYDDGDDISIEWSNAINGFAKGYYVVIVSSSANAADAKEVLKKTKKYFKDAYVKQAEVYLGCMH